MSCVQPPLRRFACLNRIKRNAPLLLLLLGLSGPSAWGADFGTIPLETFGSNDPVTLSRKAGHVLLVNFWATWCVPCRQEFPELQSLQQKLGGTGVEVVGVTADTDDAKVRQFIAATGVTFPILMDRSSALHKALDLIVMPSTALVDRSGRVVKVYQGYSRAKGLEQMEQDVRALAGKSS
jgi:peroxiredoxin